MKKSLFLAAILLTACNSNSDTGSTNSAEVDTNGLPGVNTNVEGDVALTAISGVGGIVANGVIQIQKVEDADTKIDVQLNIEELPREQFYKAWLRQSSTDQLLEIGGMRNRFKDVRYYTSLHTSDDISMYDEVVVTIQDKADLEATGEVVAKGTLRK